MKITYDLTDLPQRKGSAGRKSEEVLALIAFLADGQKRNMCIEYEEEKEAKRRYDSIRNYRSTHKLQEVFDIYRVDKQVVIVKAKKTTRRAGALRTISKPERLPKPALRQGWTVTSHGTTAQRMRTHGRRRFPSGSGTAGSRARSRTAICSATRWICAFSTAGRSTTFPT